MLLWSLCALANPFTTEGIIWRSSSEWTDEAALPKELALLRQLRAESAGWSFVHTGAVSSRAVMRGPYGGTNDDLMGLLDFMDRDSLTLTPRREGWWAKVWIVGNTEDVYGQRQQGMVRHHQEGELEAIGVERRRWSISLHAMYSAGKYEEVTAIDQGIILYREGRAVAFYQHELHLETHPSYTDQQWRARAFRQPDWEALPNHPSVRTIETVQLFSYAEDGSLAQIDSYILMRPTRVRHRTYTPEASPP